MAVILVSSGEPRHWRRLVSGGAAVGVALGLGLLNATSAAAEDDPATLPPLQVVVLVDESASLTDSDVVKEKEAARTIAFSVLADTSVVSVVGFGSSNGPGQSPVDVVCPPTPLTDAQSRDSLAKCVGDLHRRTPGEGADTDHAAALQQALSFVKAGGPKQKIVFLLTDGKLDVSNSPAYGDTAARRNAAAAGAVRQALDDLDRAGAQVWPLGFGSVDESALRDFTRGRSCAPGAGNPAARVTPDSATLVAAVAEAFSSASCVKYGQTSVGDVAAGGSTDLTIEIPAVASDASILVYKKDPSVQVEYRAPGQDKPAPAAGGTAFEFAGQTTATESVRISDPAPGRWTIHLSSATVRADNVAATVVYQAAVKAVLTVNPPQPVAGQPVDVDMQVWARGRAIIDSQALHGLSFVATMSGAGVTAHTVTLADPGGDGTFTARVAVPATATGSLTFTGQVSGVGIGGDTRTYSTRVQGQSEAVQGQILFDRNRATVHPGTRITGTITTANDSGRTAVLRVVVADPSAGAALTLDPATVTAAAGTSSHPFTLTVTPQNRPGVISATLRLVDDADTGTVVAERLFAADVVPVPTIWQKLRWLWIGLAALLLLALLFLLRRWRARSRAKRVGGLTAQLLAGGMVASEVDPTNPKAKVFRFVLNEDFTGPQLQPASAGESGVFEVRRNGAALELNGPTGRRTVTPGEPRPIRKDLALVVLDGRLNADQGGFGPVEPIGYDPFGGAAVGASIPAARSERSGWSAETAPDPLADMPPQPATPRYEAADDYGAGGYGVTPYDVDDPFGASDAKQAGPGREIARGDGYADPYNPF